MITTIYHRLIYDYTVVLQSSKEKKGRAEALH